MVVTPWQVAFILFPALTILHLYISPYTKVEESFNIQAIHDILEYGVPFDNAAQKFKALFDHMTFPGAVPRTFVGSLVVSGLALPEIWLGELVGKASQNHVRAVLGGMNATALAIFARSVEKAYGPITSVWYVALQASQFHLWYYASRTLPNMFSFFLSTIALACLLPNPTSSIGPVKRTRLGLYLLTVATVIFRSELAILLAANCAWLFLKPQTLDAKLSLIRTAFIPSILPGALISLLLTVAIDTYFWQSSTYLWPEFSAFISNVFPSKDSLGASAWGTQPFYWYLAVALPRLLMNQIVMVDLFFAFPQTLVDTRILDNLIPSYAYVLLYSILPHKETRFMFPVVPSLTLVAAMTCTRLTINMNKNVKTKTLFYLAVLSTIVTAFVSHAILLPLSAQNYPGGHALEQLHDYYHTNFQAISPLHNKDPSQPQIHVHLSNLALQSGVTRFLEQPLPANYTQDKSSIHLSQSSEKRHAVRSPGYDPIVLPGDMDHPALTIYPKIPTATPSVLPDKRSFQNPTWIYDKTSGETIPNTHEFWSQFDFVIVEDPAQVIGSFEAISEVKSLGSPSVLRPQQEMHRRYTPKWTTPDELWLFWTSQTENERKSTDGTPSLLQAMYPPTISILLTRLHDLAHDVLRLGPLSPTRGYWIDLPLATKLYILQNTASIRELPPEIVVDDPAISNPNPSPNLNADTDPGESHDTPSLLDHGTPHNQDQERLPADWNELGPLVVNKDGSLSRLENWKVMNVQERKRTVEYLRKRNLMRMEGEGAVE